MGKFNEMLLRDGEGVMTGRSERIIKIAKMGQETLVAEVEKDLMILQDKQEAMIEMSPDNRFSLKPGEDFEVESWVAEYQKLSIDIELKIVELKVAQENLSVLFGTSGDADKASKV